MLLNKTIRITLLVVSIFTAGCATYYQQNYKFQQFVTHGQLDQAKDYLDKKTAEGSGKNKILYFMNKGWVFWMLGQYKESSEAFIKADNFIDEQSTNYGLEALSLISNPNVKPYKPEDFEGPLINYYNALNYISLNQYDEAMVECRRIDLKLGILNSKYPDYKNKYKRDAFANMMMGLLYEAGKDYNNAFIAYRNAADIYESDYKQFFGVDIPEQLKKDLLHSAYKTGFYDQVDFYEKKFNIKYEDTVSDGGELVFLWHNGLGPVKGQWSINLTVNRGQPDWIVFGNSEYGITFPFYLGNLSPSERNAFSGFSMFRVAFPKYNERKPLFTSALIEANNKNYKLETVQNINEIAFKTLNDRMLREFATALLRIAVKKALEASARAAKENDLAAAISIVNAITEQADTRNWQTIPYSIYYTRISLPAGEQNIKFKTFSLNGEHTYDIKVNIEKGKTCFKTFSSLESCSPTGE